MADSHTKDTECRAGICFRPRWARCLAKPKVLTACFGYILLIQGMAGMHFVGSMTTYERHFQLQTKDMGTSLSVSELVPIFVSLISGYICDIKKDRPRWMGAAALFISISYIIRALPYFVYGPPSDRTLMSTDGKSLNNISRICILNDELPNPNTTDSAANGQCVQDPASEHGKTAILIYTIGQTASVCGDMILRIVGTSYLDDNVAQKNSPMHIAIVSALRTFSPLLGFFLSGFCLSLYVDLSKPDMNTNDPQWVGAWWLGYVIMAPMMALGGLLIVQFPKHLPADTTTPATQLEMKNISNLIRHPVTDATEVPSLWTKIIHALKEFFHALWCMMKNKLWLLRTLSILLTTFALEIYAFHSSKFMEHQFHLSASSANFWSGTAVIAPLIIGDLCVGGYIKFFVPSPRKLAFIMAFSKVILAASMLCLMFFRCSSAYIAGIHENAGTCDVSCECPSVPFQPVCVDGSRNFLSGCHAGCTSVNATTKGAVTYNGCSCAEDGLAQSGFCDASCWVFPIYITIATLGHFFTAFDIVAGVIFIFRCVPVDKKAFAMGLVEVALSLFVFIPAPLIFSFLIDGTCMLWNKTCGDEEGACLLYNIDNLRYVVHSIPVIFLSLACMCEFLFARKANEIDMYGEEKKREENND